MNSLRAATLTFFLLVTVARTVLAKAPNDWASTQQRLAREKLAIRRRLAGPGSLLSAAAKAPGTVAAVAAAGAAALYGAKKLKHAVFAGWGCECSLVKAKRNSCQECGTARPNNGLDWYCNCIDDDDLPKLRDAKLTKCHKCKAYQMWVCPECSNSKSEDYCKGCDTEKTWNCGECDADVSINEKLCTSCKDGIRPRQCWEKGVKYFGDGNETLNILGDAMETKEGDREWLFIFPNRLSGIIVLTACFVMILVALVMACLFCQRRP